MATGYSEVRERAPVRGGHWILLVLLLAPLVVMYYDTALKLAGDWWNDDNNSHGILIPPLALYFAWRKRGRWLSLPEAPCFWLGTLAALFSLAVYFVGRLGAEFFLSRTSGIILAASLILFFKGWQHLKLMSFPLGLLVLGIPIPALIFNTVSLPLQALASEMSAGFLSFCNVPVLREGNVLNLASTSLGVAEACSGLRSLVSLIALAVILGYLRWRGVWQKVLLVALAVPLALLLNILRIAITGLIADFWDVKYAMGFFHSFSGWLVFVVAFVALYGFSALIQWFLPSPPPEAA